MRLTRAEVQDVLLRHRAGEKISRGDLLLVARWLITVSAQRRSSLALMAKDLEQGFSLLEEAGVGVPASVKIGSGYTWAERAAAWVRAALPEAGEE